MVVNKKLKNLIGIIKGGGTGPELIESAIAVIRAIEDLTGQKFNLEYFDNERWYNQINFEVYNRRLHEAFTEFFNHIKKSNGIILRGAINAPVLYKLREEFNLIYKVTPIHGIPELSDLTRFSKDGLKGLDIVLTRENIHGLFHAINRKYSEKMAEILVRYPRRDVEDYAHFVFKLAKQRNKHLHLAMPTRKTGVIGKLWEEVFETISKSYPQVNFHRMYSNINNPCRWIQTRKEFDEVYGPFDVIAGPDDLMDSFMDDMAWAVHGELTMAPSGDFSRDGFASYQTVHGTQRPIAGKDEANPIGMIHALAMAFEYSFGMKREADMIRKAVRKTLAEGYRTTDIYRGKSNTKLVGTKEMTEKIIQNLYEG